MQESFTIDTNKIFKHATKQYACVCIIVKHIFIRINNETFLNINKHA